MKKFWSKYWLPFLLNIFFLLVMILSAIFGNEYLHPNAYIKFTFYSLVVLFFVPIYSVIYGSLSYIASKKTLFPQMMLLITLSLEFLFYKLIRPDSNDTIIVFLLFVAFNVFISTIALGITALIFEYIDKYKK